MLPAHRGEKGRRGDGKPCFCRAARKALEYVDHILHEITQEVFAGNIDADPYARTPQQSACTYCEFASACHFENGCGSDRMEYIKATKNDEFWQYIDEVNGEGAHENG